MENEEEQPKAALDTDARTQYWYWPKLPDISAQFSGGRVIRIVRWAASVLAVFTMASIALFLERGVNADGGSGKKTAGAEKADYILTDAKIYTADSGRHMAEALAVRDGKIVFVGSAAEAAKLAGKKTVIQKAGGKLVLPGLIDSHMHPTGIVDFGGCDLKSKARTLAEITDFVRACIEKQKPEEGKWVEVIHWEFGAGNQPDPQHPTLRAALDAASTKHPISMTGWDGHHGAFNSMALAGAKNDKGEVVGYSKMTIARDFSKLKNYIGVDANGEPTGDVSDQGKGPVKPRVPGGGNHDLLMKSPEKITEFVNGVGITAIQDAAATAGSYEIYDELIKKRPLTVRLNIAQLYLPERYRDDSGKIDYNKLFAQADEIRKRYAANPLTRADAVKVFADGVPEANPNNVPPTLGNSPRPTPYLQPIFEKDAKGALSVKGYVDLDSPVCAYVRAKPEEYAADWAVAEFEKQYGFHPGQCAIWYGVPEHEPAIFNEYIKRAHLAGYTIHIHAISDTALSMAIDAIEGARAADGKDSQPDTIAHIQFVTPENAARLAKDHIYLAFTYSWFYAEPNGYDMSIVPFINRVSGNSYEALHDPNSYMEKYEYPVKTVKERGGILVAGSDAPVLTNDPQPFVNMEMAITRKRRDLPPLSPWERIGIRDVLDAYTINGAHALGRASEIGSLETGKSADFILVDQDILALGDEGHPEKIGDTKVLETWFMGRKVYSAKMP
jgi:predicted amidohydrolase YtcJ